METIQQALTELERKANPPGGIGVAIDVLRSWPAHATPTVTDTKLLLSYPNPFNLETWIPYQLAADADVVISIYDIGGALVK